MEDHQLSQTGTENNQSESQNILQNEPKRYFRALGNPMWYIWGLVAVFVLLAAYTFLAIQRNYWPFQIEPAIQRTN